MKLLLGKIDNENIYLSKHSWDCDWYWGFGYIGNSKSHFHIDSLLNEVWEVNKIFTNATLTQSAWWITRELFHQAYGLKQAAAIYRRGANQVISTGLTDSILSSSKEDQINADLEKVLDTLWDYLTDQLK
jgi:hypothetical protein